MSYNKPNIMSSEHAIIDFAGWAHARPCWGSQQRPPPFWWQPS